VFMRWLWLCSLAAVSFAQSDRDTTLPVWEDPEALLERNTGDESFAGQAAQPELQPVPQPLGTQEQRRSYSSGSNSSGSNSSGANSSGANSSGANSSGTSAPSPPTFTWTLKLETQTSISQPISAGVTTLPVLKHTNFKVGRTLVINRGGTTEEYGVVQGFGSLILQSPTQFAHAATETVEQITEPLSFCPDGGTHVGHVQNLVLSSSIQNATIYYTLDGSTATNTSTVYTPGSALSVSTTTTVCAVGIAGAETSGSSCRVFTVSAGSIGAQLQAPVFSLPSGAVKIGDKLAITTGDSNAALYWSATSTYSAPSVCNWQSPANGTLIINFASKTTSQVTISAFAAMSGHLHSEIRTATYTVALDEGFSIGLGASRLKFKEQEL